MRWAADLLGILLGVYVWLAFWPRVLTKVGVPSVLSIWGGYGILIALAVAAPLWSQDWQVWESFAYGVIGLVRVFFLLRRAKVAAGAISN